MDIPQDIAQEIEAGTVKEIFEDAPATLLKLMQEEAILYCLDKKRGSSEPSARVLANWLNDKIIFIKEEDKGKIKRFDKLEATWLNIVITMRNFGVSIENIKKPRRFYFDYTVKTHTLFKLKFLWSILISPQIITMDEEGNMMISAKNLHGSRFNTKSTVDIPTHICMDFNRFIRQEYPKALFLVNFGIREPLESLEKLKLLFFLKTGEYKSIKVKLAYDDIRYFEETTSLLNIAEVREAFEKWKFIEILVNIDNKKEIKIKPK